jgi:hypothetical protein
MKIKLYLLKKVIKESLEDVFGFKDINLNSVDCPDCGGMLFDDSEVQCNKSCNKCCKDDLANDHMYNSVNEKKCSGWKKAPVGSPKQRSFCKRHCGMKKKLTSKEVADDPDSCINQGLRRWKCRCR